MKNYKPSEDGSTSVDPFLAIMGKEYDGHRRLYGKGVTNRLINKVSYIFGTRYELHIFLSPSINLENITNYIVLIHLTNN